MAEQFMTRRERREAERRAAEQAFEAGLPAEGPAEVAAAEPASEPAAQAQPDPEHAESAPTEGTCAEASAGSQADSVPAAGQPSAPAGQERFEEAAAAGISANDTVPAAEQEVQEPEAWPQPHLEDAHPTADRPAAEPPVFTSRRERREWLRRQQAAQEADGAHDDSHRLTSDKATGTGAADDAAASDSVADESAQAEETHEPVDSSTQPSLDDASLDIAATDDAPEQAEVSEGIDEDAAHPDAQHLAARAEPEDGADPSDLLARRQARKTPVVKPPNTQGITVVSSEPLDGEDSARWEARTAIGDVFRRNASWPSTAAMDSVDADEEEITSEEWQSDTGRPAEPMSARAVTHQDGEILVGNRPSTLPFILLAIGGGIALTLIIIALFMLF